MTKSNLVTVKDNIGQDDAKRLLHRHRIEKLLVVDDDYQCIGLITVKDIEKAEQHPIACKDERGGSAWRRRPRWATTASSAPSG